MRTENTDRNIQWLPILLIAWNIFDAGLHIAVDLVEPGRIAGNIVAIMAAIIVLMGLTKSYAPYVLLLSAVVIVILNLTEPLFPGFAIVVLTFIGVTLLLLLRWAQVKFVEANSGIKEAEIPVYLGWWGAILVTLVGLLFINLMDRQNVPPRYAFMSIEQTDTTADRSLPREINGQSAELLSAFFGLDNNLPRTAENLCPGTSGKDGMPVIFSHEIDLNTMQTGDFQITTASGEIGSLICVTLAPAVNEGELRTVLLVGDYGSAEQDPPVLVEIVGNLHSIDNNVNFKGAEVMVTPLEPGPSLVFAEIVPEDEWRLEGGCLAEGVKQIVRVAWAGGVVLENGDEPGDAERQLYTVTVEATDGSTRDVIPVGLGDLGDGDNNHELCLDTLERPLSVSFPVGILVDPNDDLNPATSVQVTYLP